MTPNEPLPIHGDEYFEVESSYNGEKVRRLFKAAYGTVNLKTGRVDRDLRHYTGACSICGKVAEITNFCPNCGAKMKEGDEK